MQALAAGASAALLAAALAAALRAAAFFAAARFTAFAFRAACVYDLRHTFATMALRAGISTFDRSRYMGASLTMIDRHYGHLARDGRDHAIRLLDQLHADGVHGVDISWTPPHPHDTAQGHEKAA